MFDIVLAGVITDAPSLGSIITRILMWMLGVFGTVALTMLVVGGAYILTSGGDLDRVQKGKGIVLYAVVGLTVVLSSYIVVQFIGSIFSGA